MSTSPTSTSPDITALATLSELEHRLQRLSFYLTGTTSTTSTDSSDNTSQLHTNLKPEDRKHSTPQARLASLEAQLADLAKGNRGVRGLLELRMFNLLSL